MKKILIVKLGAIGDVILAMPLLSTFKDCEITWIVGPQAAPLVRATREISHVLEIPNPLKNKARSLLTAWRSLFGKSYDLIINAHADPRYRLLTLFCRGEKRVSLNRHFGNRIPIPGRYHADEYLRLIGEKDPKWPKLTLPPAPDLPTSFITLFPGGITSDERKLRTWPLENYVKLADRLIQTSYEVALIGGKEDRHLSSSFAHLRVHDHIGKTALLETISLLEKSSLLISHDGGPLHMAKLARCKVLGLFGPTNPREFMSRDDVFLWGGEKLACAPCYDGKYFSACKNPLCMKTLTVDTVLTCLEKYLSSSSFVPLASTEKSTTASCFSTK